MVGPLPKDEKSKTGRIDLKKITKATSYLGHSAYPSTDMIGSK